MIKESDVNLHPSRDGKRLAGVYALQGDVVTQFATFVNDGEDIDTVISAIEKLIKPEMNVKIISKDEARRISIRK